MPSPLSDPLPKEVEGVQPSTSPIWRAESPWSTFVVGRRDLPDGRPLDKENGPRRGKPLTECE